MKWRFWQKDIEQKDVQFETLLRLIGAGHPTSSGISVTPDDCMRAPTVNAIVTAISRRFAVTPVSVYRKTTSEGRDSKEKLPNHPVARLLQYPGDLSSAEYWMDAVSSLVRWNRFFAYIGRGTTGPIRYLDPIQARHVGVEKQLDGSVVFKVADGAGMRTLTRRQIHYVRGPSRNFASGDSPIEDCAEAIAMEIAAEKFGATFFGNGALPLTVFKFLQGSKGFRTDDEQSRFIDSFQSAFSGSKRFRALMLPAGMDSTQTPVDNDKAQFIETRKLIRTVIAGAFGIPLHMVGDLENAHYNNVEQQDTDFTQNVILPYARMFESAMERDFLTDEDRRDGIVIRFNLDAIQRADIKSRAEANRIYIEAGVLSPNEVREREGLNAIPPEKGGDDYRIPRNMMATDEEPEPKPEPTPSLRSVQ